MLTMPVGIIKNIHYNTNHASFSPKTARKCIFNSIFQDIRQVFLPSCKSISEFSFVKYSESFRTLQYRSKRAPL